MLALQFIREHPDDVRRSLELRRTTAPLERILELDEQRRSLLADVESMRADRNRAGKAIGAAKESHERQRLIEEQRAVAGRLDEMEERLRELERELERLLLEVPNIPHPDVPVGGEEDGVVVIEGDAVRGERRVEPLVPKHQYPEPEREERDRPHWELGTALGIIDFERGVKVAGSPFYFMVGDGARLQRALITWMLEVHRQQGYQEVYPPFAVLEEALVGTGQLPKFADTMFHLEGTRLWLNPTAEVPVTNMYREEILELDALPIWHTAYAPSFRWEKFSAGREVRGIKRLYQFDKVEMVKFVEPGTSWQELDALLENALELIRPLGLRYRVLRLATADITFASAMTYDIEVWAPGAGEWLEVSSVSNFLDFQARRANIRYRDAEGRPQHLHTLNGSGLALPRLIAALMEAHQQEDGSIALPAVIRPYLGGQATIEPPSPRA